MTTDDGEPIHRQAYTVRLLFRGYACVFMGRLECGARGFYDSDGFPIADLGEAIEHEEYLGNFETWEEFELLCGIKLHFVVDACDECQKVSILPRKQPVCSECRSLGAPDSTRAVN